MTDAVAPALVARERSENRFLATARKLLRHKIGMTGLVIILIIIICAAAAPLLAPYDPAEIDYENMTTAPSWAHPLGTDEIGRDILSRLIYGAQVSLKVVFVSIIISLVIGGTIGLISGYAGGRTDNIIMRIMDALLAFPMLILALGIITVLGPSLINAILALAIVNVPGFARLVRGQTLSIRELDFVQAARAIGASDIRIMVRHVWPSVAGNVIVYASLRASAVLIAESSLAFLGLGAEPPTPTWGQMLAIAMEYWSAWWMSVFPGLAIFLAALAFNFFGDGVRDVMDVRLSD